MSRHTTKPDAIIVESRNRLDRWAAVGARLHSLDLERFDRALAMADAYVAVYESPNEPIAEFNARIATITGGKETN